MKNKIADIYDSSVHGIDKKHIPELRFPEFANTGEWEEKKLDDIIQIISPAKKLQSSEYLIAGTIPIIDQSQQFICGYTNDKEALLNAQQDNLIIFGDHTCCLKLINFPFAQGADGIKIFRSKAPTKIDTIYIYQQLLSQPLQTNEYKRHFSDLKKLDVRYPDNYLEQQKIADCLSFIDEQILATQQKWELLKEHKRGLMQKLFPANGKTTPDFRFPEFANAGEWEEKQLNTIGETLGGLSGKNAEDFGQGEPYVTYKQVFAGARIKFNDCQLVQILPNESQNKLQYGDVLITMSSETPNEIGYSAVVTSKPLKSYYLNSFCFIFRYKNSIAIDPLFSIYLFQSNLYRINVIRIAQGITRYNISPSKFLDIKLSFPSFAEQKKIAQCLSSVDEQILATQQKWDFLKEHKRGLMQRLFPNNDIDFKN